MELSLGYKLMSETFFEDEKCGIIEIPYLQVTDPWYAIKKNSSFKELFKIGYEKTYFVWKIVTKSCFICFQIDANARAWNN